MTRKLSTLIGCSVTVLATVQAQGSLIANGDFEATPWDSGWTYSGSAATQFTPGLDGVGSAMQVTGGEAGLVQANPTGTLNLGDNWSLSLQFATDDNFSNSAGNNGLRMRAWFSSTNASEQDRNFDVRVNFNSGNTNSQGTPGRLFVDSTMMFNDGDGGSLASILPTDLSVSEPTLNIYQLEVTGTIGQDVIGIKLVDTDNNVFTDTFNFGAKFTGSAIQDQLVRIEFMGNFGSTSTFVVDNVSYIPEPGSLALLGLGGLLMLGRSRRR